MPVPESTGALEFVDEPTDVLAETVIRVCHANFTGELELWIPHQVNEPDEASSMRTVYFAFPDAESLLPGTAKNVPVAFLVSDLDNIIAAMQTAVARARAISVLPKIGA